MKALVYTQSRRLELQELPQPRPKRKEVLLQIRAVGICGSDLDGFLGKSKKRIPPLILGHEFSGQIVDTGEGVSGARVGEAVTVYPLVTCGICRFCQNGQSQICTKRKLFGLDLHGAMAEYLAVPEECLVKIPSGVSCLEGALVEPLSVALHAVKKSPSIDGETVLIFGAGSIGLLSFWAARQFGAAKIAVVDVNPHRLSVVQKLGADLVINAGKQNVVKAILEWTDGFGVGFSIDAVGNKSCRERAIAATRSAGTIALVGLAEETYKLDVRAVMAREIELKGSYAYSRDDFAEALALMAEKKLPVASFVSETPLSEGQQVFEKLIEKSSPLTKVVLKM